MTTVLVTGGAGFIGSHLCEMLLEHGFSVRVLDNFSSGKYGNIAHFVNDIKVIEGDITSIKDLQAALTQCDVVVHLAAIVSVQRSFSEVLLVHDTNILGTLMVLKTAQEAGVKKIVFASSCAVYGDADKPISEDFIPAPKSLYAVSKLTGEYYCNVFYKTFGISTVALRFFNVFGPRQDAASSYAGVIAAFTAKMLCREAPIIYGDGGQSRDFIYVEDVAQAIVKAVLHNGLGGEIINVARGDSHSIKKVAEVIANLLEVDILPVYAPPIPGDIRFSQGDTKRLTELLNFEASTPFKDGLRKTLSWYESQYGYMKVRGKS